MKTTRIFLAALTLLMLTSAFTMRKTVTVFMIGDSTMANKDTTGGKQERGWGMMLQQYFKSGVVVDNHAVNGRSSKSFIDEGRWDVVLSKMKPGDYVIIQFGHNDEKPAADRHTDPGTTFDANLRRFVLESRARGGIPILCNAVVRRNFYRQVDSSVDDESLRNTTYEDEKVNSDTLIDTHGAYLLSPRNVARELGVPFIDANRVIQGFEREHHLNRRAIRVCDDAGTERDEVAVDLWDDKRPFGIAAERGCVVNHEAAGLKNARRKRLAHGFAGTEKRNIDTPEVERIRFLDCQIAPRRIQRLARAAARCQKVKLANRKLQRFKTVKHLASDGAGCANYCHMCAIRMALYLSVHRLPF